MTQNRYKGVLTLQDIKDRCYVDDVTGHWHWRASMTSSGNGNRSPYVWYPPLQQSISLARAIHLIRNGEPPPRGKVSYRACHCWDCVNPAHFRLGSRSEMGKHSRPSNSALHNAKISATVIAKIGSKKTPSVHGNSVFNLAG